jgi:hypothetical protein
MSSISVSEVLAHHYLTEMKDQKANVGLEASEDIMQSLSNAYPDWTWEVVDDRHLLNDISIITVRVYIPGRVLFGRTSYSLQEANEAHYRAIADACKSLNPNKSLIKKTEQPVAAPQQIPAPSSKPAENIISEQEIMDIVMSNNAKVDKQIVSDTTEQQQPQTGTINSLSELKNDPRTEVPFEEISNQCFDEMAAAISPAPAKPQPANTAHGFSTEQINAMKKIKADFNILNDDMLGNYINSWNPKLSKKSDLTPENVNGFIQWAENLGGCPC